jgi:hypothetical protein
MQIFNAAQAIAQLRVPGGVFNFQGFSLVPALAAIAPPIPL